MGEAIEAEFKSATHTRAYIVVILVCILIGFLGSTAVMLGGEPTGAIMLSGFVAIPLVVCVFLAVRDSASTPSIIVSDRGLERSNADRTTVVPWATIASVGLFREGRTTRIRYLTSEALEGAVEEFIGDLDPDDPRDAELIDLDEVERIMRAEQAVIADVEQWGAPLPAIPAARADAALLAWDPLLRRFAGIAYQGVRDGAGQAPGAG